MLRGFLEIIFKKRDVEDHSERRMLCQHADDRQRTILISFDTFYPLLERISVYFSSLKFQRMLLEYLTFKLP